MFSLYETLARWPRKKARACHRGCKQPSENRMVNLALFCPYTERREGHLQARARVLDAFCSENHGVQQNRKIHKEASIPDVVEVVFNVFVDGGGAIGA